MKYLGLFSEERRPGCHEEAFAILQALNLKVGRAWAIKEALRTLRTYRQPAAVKRSSPAGMVGRFARGLSPSRTEHWPRYTRSPAVEN
jgi:hypothetical protein